MENSSSDRRADINNTDNLNKTSYDEVFNQLDKNHDGRIDVHELIDLLEKMDTEIPQKARMAMVQRIMKQASGSKDSWSMSFQQFKNYIAKQERKLRLVFRHVDTDHHGKFDAKQLMDYFQKIGIDLDLLEAKKLVQKMDTDKSLEISFDEWRSFFISNPVLLDSITNDPRAMLRYWRAVPYLDVGESPAGAPEDAITEGQLWWKNLVAGGFAGAVSRTATAPFDRLKIIMQYLGSRQHVSLISGCRYLIKEGGVKSLWRGNGVNVLKIIPETALRFAVYEESKKVIKYFQKKDADTETTITERFVAGAAAGFISQTVVYPLDVLKVRLCLRRSGEMSHWSDAIKRIYHFEGPKAFWRGYVLNQIGIVPYAGFDLACYESLKRLYIKTHDNKEPPIYVVLGCGALSSFAGQLVTYPIALIKIRRQGQAVPLPTMDQSKAHPLLPAPEMFRQIWKNEGIPGLYRGIVPNMLKVIPAVSISYLVYESVLKKIS